VLHCEKTFCLADQFKYDRRVIKACQIKHGLDLLNDGDLTEFDERRTSHSFCLELWCQVVFTGESIYTRSDHGRSSDCRHVLL
jgi:hypothetical protein